MSSSDGNDRDLIKMSEDSPEGIEAFERVIAKSRPWLQSYVKGKGVREADADDIEQQVVQKLFSRRIEFHFKEWSKWRAYLKTTAKTTLIDFLERSKGEEASLDATATEIPDEEQSIWEIIARSIRTEKLLAYADELWLGCDAGVPRREHDRKLLAAQLFFLHQLPWQAVILMLGGKVTRSELDDWCSDPAVLRNLSFRSLHMTGEQLAASVLGLPSSEASELDELYRNGSGANPVGDPPAGWTWGEAIVIIERYRHNLEWDKVASRSRFALEAIDSIRDRCGGTMPFVPVVKKLRTSLARAGCDANHFLRDEVWRRLAFEYRYIDGQPVKDVQDRVEFAAAEVGIKLNFGVLNMWLSGGRLLKQLGNHMGERNV